jgi:prophage maintenance system killer protein
LSGLEASLATPKNLWAYGGERISISCALMFLGGSGIQIHVTDDDLVFHTVRAARCRQADRNQEVDSIALWLQLAASRR